MPAATEAGAKRKSFPKERGGHKEKNRKSVEVFSETLLLSLAHLDVTKLKFFVNVIPPQNENKYTKQRNYSTPVRNPFQTDVLY